MARKWRGVLFNDSYFASALKGCFLRLITNLVSEKSIALKNIEIWQKSGIVTSVDIEIKNGRVQRIMSSSGISGGFPRRILLPLGVDTQVHLRTLGQEHKETAESGLKAALCGGYGAVLAMPNTKPAIDNPAVLVQSRLVLSPLERALGVRVLHSAALSVGQQGKVLTDFDTLSKTGASAFTDDGVGLANSLLMEQAFKTLEQVQLPLLQHAEFSGHGGILANGPIQRRLGLTPYPASAEADMVGRDIKILRQFPKARYHVLHVSAAETLTHLKRAKEDGLNITAEVAPHHLFFSADQIKENDSSFKMNPPLRSSNDRAALKEALRTGLIDWVATDHAPHEIAAKSTDFTQAAFGTLGLETALPVLFELYSAGELSAKRLVEVFSTSPAHFLGLDPQWSSIEEGRPLRGVLVELANQQLFRIHEGDLQSLSKNSCFNETMFRSRVIQVFNNAGIWTVS